MTDGRPRSNFPLREVRRPYGGIPTDPQGGNGSFHFRGLCNRSLLGRDWPPKTQDIHTQPPIRLKLASATGSFMAGRASSCY